MSIRTIGCHVQLATGPVWKLVWALAGLDSMLLGYYGLTPATQMGLAVFLKHVRQLSRRKVELP